MYAVAWLLCNGTRQNVTTKLEPGMPQRFRAEMRKDVENYGILYSD